MSWPLIAILSGEDDMDNDTRTSKRLSTDAIASLYNQLRPYPSESQVTECLKELLDRRAADEPRAELAVDPSFEGTRCPFTKRAYFMHLDHPELGRVPTYGGPFDSYTIPEPDEDSEFTLRCERYDHDAGDWIEGGEPLPWHIISNDELVRIHNMGAPPTPPPGECFGDPEILINSKEWLRKALTTAGATSTGSGVGGGQADIDIELQGCEFNVSIRPRLRPTSTKEVRPPFGECTAVVNNGADLCTEQAEPGTHRCKRHSLGEGA